MKAQTGTLRLRSTGEYEFWLPDGTILDVAPSDAPLEVPLEVFIEGDTIERWRRDTSQPAYYRDTTRKDIALIGLVTDESWVERTRKEITQAARKHENLLRWQAGEAWRITVTPYVFLVESRDRYGLNSSAGWEDLRERIAAVNPDADHNYLHLTGVGGGGGSGVAYVGSGLALTYDPTNYKTLLHEQGHNFGLTHHTKGGNEYGGYSWMGHGGWGYPAPNLDYMGLMPGEHIARGPGRYYLVDPDTNPLAMERGEHKLVYLDEPGSIAVSVLGDKIVLDKHSSGFDPEPPWAGCQNVAMLRPGETAFDGLVKFVRWRRGAAEVAIGEAPSRPAPEITLPDEPAPMAGKTGIWHHSAYTHQGFDIHVLTDDDGQPARVVLYWFCWSHPGSGYEAGQWLEGQGRIENNIAHLELYAPRRGDIQKTHEKVGEAVLYFYDDRRGVIKYHADVDEVMRGRGAIQLENLSTPVDHPLYGLYAFDGHKHEGLSVTVNHKPANPAKGIPEDPEHVVAYWYGYAGTKYRPRTDWHVAQGHAGDTLTLYKPVGGMLNVRTRSKLEKVGTCELTETEFRFNGKTYPLTRLA